MIEPYLNYNFYVYSSLGNQMFTLHFYVFEGNLYVLGNLAFFTAADQMFLGFITALLARE